MQEPENRSYATAAVPLNPVAPQAAAETEIDKLRRMSKEMAQAIAMRDKEISRLQNKVWEMERAKTMEQRQAKAAPGTESAANSAIGSLSITPCPRGWSETMPKEDGFVILQIRHSGNRFPGVVKNGTLYEFRGQDITNRLFPPEYYFCPVAVPNPGTLGDRERVKIAEATITELKDNLISLREEHLRLIQSRDNAAEMIASIARSAKNVIIDAAALGFINFVRMEEPNLTSMPMEAKSDQPMPNTAGEQ